MNATHQKAHDVHLFKGRLNTIFILSGTVLHTPPERDVA